MPQFSDDIFLGTAETGMGMNPALGEPSPMDKGVGPLGRIYVWDTVPAVLANNNIALAQILTASAVLTAGAGNTAIVKNGVPAVQLDVPRAVSVTTGAGTPTIQPVTIRGFDYYGQPMSEVINSSGVASTAVLGKKAFYQISSITVPASTVVTIAVGTTDILGLPVRVVDPAYIARVGYNGVIATDAGTFVAAATATATPTTGDVRGTYLPSVATNGTRRLVMGILLAGIAVGPNATRLGALGVPQA